MAIIISGNGIDMGQNAISNASQVEVQDKQLTPFSGFKNLIINGGFGIWQRGTSISTDALNTLKYCADRWYLHAQGANITASQDVPLSGGSISSIKLTGSAGNTQASLGQRIEDLNCLGLVENPSIISFKAKASVVKTLYYSVSYASGSINNDWTTYAVITSGSLNILTTEKKFNINVPYSPNAYKGVRIEVWCQLGAGETINISTFQWEIGSIATPFENRPYGLELSLCQRYYEVSPRIATNLIVASNSFLGGIVGWNYKVQKRVNPTIFITQQLGTKSAMLQFNVLSGSGFVPTIQPTNVADYIELDATASAEL